MRYEYESMLTVVALPALLSLVACASAEPPVSVDGCDIAQESCQRQVLALVAAERGEELPPLPRIELLPDNYYTPIRDDPPILVSGPGWSWDWALGALHVLALNKLENTAAAEELASNRASYFDLKEQTVKLSRPAELPADPRLRMGLLAHELTHYMQNLHTPFSNLYAAAARTYDSVAATHALIEGEATVVAWRVQARLFHTSPEAVDWDKQFDLQEEQYLNELPTSSSPLTAALTLLPYPIGGRRIAKLWAEQGRASVAALFNEFPHSIADWLALGGAARGSVLTAVSCEAPLAPEGFVRREDTLSVGVIGAVSLLAAADATDLDLASNVRADRMTIYTRADIAPGIGEWGVNARRTLVAWQLVFDDERSAIEFATALAPLGLIQRRTGHQVLVTASWDPLLDSATLLVPGACTG